MMKCQSWIQFSLGYNNHRPLAIDKQSRVQRIWPRVLALICSLALAVAEPRGPASAEDLEC